MALNNMGTLEKLMGNYLQTVTPIWKEVTMMIVIVSLNLAVATETARMLQNEKNMLKSYILDVLREYMLHFTNSECVHSANVPWAFLYVNSSL